MEKIIIDFQKDVIERSYSIPVLVDFWADWCGPCKVLSPILERLAEKYKGNWELVKIDTDEHTEIATEYGIRGIPNVKLFHRGKVIDEFTGALPENSIEQWLKKAIPSKYDGEIERAKNLIEENKTDEAKIILEKILKDEPSNEEVKLLLAEILLFMDHQRVPDLVKNIDGTPSRYELAESLKTLAGLFERLERDDAFPEGNSKELYILALHDLKGKRFDKALEKFIDIIRNDRNYDDDGARKACIAIFKFLGEEDPTTRKYRRDFGSALYI